ncbi:hypothetical protein SAMN05444401_0874 [Clostridium amylolyticum]|uniref:Uncharacterized protein n=1 Tax=Clostridium amylolyticum TaxID=1121298 RepID=A0A1M6BSM2_9CLOT|nr:hypothetical protein SAMN05444401_0874 [Clostridium amylolyticum]
MRIRWKIYVVIYLLLNNNLEVIHIGRKIKGNWNGIRIDGKDKYQNTRECLCFTGFKRGGRTMKSLAFAAICHSREYSN